jgi:hypothetical protein
MYCHWLVAVSSRPSVVCGLAVNFLSAAPKMAAQPPSLAGM